MKTNAAGLVVAGHYNPNWKGGLIDKTCAVCGSAYRVKRAHSSSKFCSMKCVGVSQRGVNNRKAPPRRVEKLCAECGKPFEVYSSHINRYKCCSKECSDSHRAKNTSGAKNPNWCGGLSRFPYPWNFNEISRKVISRDGGACQNPSCAGADARMTTHHINYDKQDCRSENLIALCSACNSKANFRRDKWSALYSSIIQQKKDGGGWSYEVFE